MKNSFATIMKRLFFLLLLLGIFINLTSIIPEVTRDLPTIVESIHQPALWRSARFFRSERFANYIDFIYKTVPEDEKILIPLDELNTWKTLGSRERISYYLQKYDLVQCEITYIDCVRANLDHDITILYLSSELNGLETDSLNERLLMANDEVGLILSPHFEFKEQTDFAPVTTTTLIWYTLRAFVWVSVFILTGLLWMDWFAPRLRIIQKLTLGFGFMFGASTFSLFLFMLLGSSLDVWLVVGNLLVWVAIAVWLQRKGIRDLNRFWEEIKQVEIPFALILVLLIYFAAVLFISLGKAYYSMDAISVWVARGFGLIDDGLPLGLTGWGTNATAYPLNPILWIAQTQVLFQGALPEGKLIFVLFFFALLLLSYDFLHVRVGKWKAAGAVLFYSFIPGIFWHATKAYANLAVSFYVLGAYILLVEIIEVANTNESGNSRALSPNWLVVLFLVFAAWTRPEAVNIGLVLVLFVSIVYRKQLFLNAKQGIGFALSYIAYFVLWTIIANYLYGGTTMDDTLYPKMFGQWAVGDLHIPEFFYIIRFYLGELFNASTYLIFAIICTIGISFVLTQIKRVDRSSMILMSLGAIYIFMVFGVYYVVSYIDSPSLHWWVFTGVKRLALPGEVTLWIGLVLGVFGRKELLGGE